MRRPDPDRPRRRRRRTSGFSGYLFGLAIVLLAMAVVFIQKRYS